LDHKKIAQAQTEIIEN